MDSNNLGLVWTYYYRNNSLVLESTTSLSSYYPSSSCVVQNSVLYVTALQNSGSALVPYIISYQYEYQAFSLTQLIPPQISPLSTWSIAGLQLDFMGNVATMFNWNDNNCSLAGILSDGNFSSIETPPLQSIEPLFTNNKLQKERFVSPALAMATTALNKPRVDCRSMPMA